MKKLLSGYLAAEIMKMWTPIDIMQKSSLRGPEAVEAGRDRVKQFGGSLSVWSEICV